MTRASPGRAGSPTRRREAGPWNRGRGGGIWLRYTDGSGTFSPAEETDLHPQRVSVSPAALHVLMEEGGLEPAPRTLIVEQEGCEPFTWRVSNNAAWLHTQRVGQTVRVTVDPTGLGLGTWQATITVDAGPEVLGSPVQVPVKLVMVEQIQRRYMPAVFK